MVPLGTVSFLFTDIEGSTRLWEALPAAMEPALRRHDQILRDCAALYGGHIFKTIGDAFCIAFDSPSQALEAAIAAQRQLQQENWPESASIKSRMAIHTGAVEHRDADYFGQPLNRVARLMSAAHGNQLVLSQAVFELVRDQLPDGVHLKPLGEHRLKDLQRSEPVYQVVAPGLAEQFPPIRSLTVRPNNLPLQITSFVGRERELNEIREHVLGARLVTLTGAGGTGKTRLSLQVAADLSHVYEDGVWLLEFAPVVDAADLPSAIASALNIPEAPGSTVLETIFQVLADQRRLLILDNCEHLIETISQFAGKILRHCPGISLLATSREALRIQGEQTYRVPPLSMPDPDASLTAEALGQFEAVRLFIERALLLNPDFRVTNDSAPAVASLCHQLDGIPLAIELAAARTRVLPVTEIANRLDQRFQILTGGSRTALPRQQTLRSLVDWSYELLNDPEKQVLQRLSVFAGTFDLAAVEAIAVGSGVEDWEILDHVTSLVDKSLVLPVEREGQIRYTLLETIRQYAAEKLGQSEQADDWRDRHLRFYAEEARRIREALDTAAQVTQLARFDLEMDNLRAAVRWGMHPQCKERPSLGTLVAALCRFWYVRGRLVEGESTTRAVIELADESWKKVDLSTLQNALGLCAYHRGEYRLAQSHYECAAGYARDLGDLGREAVAYNNIANVHLMEGTFHEAVENYDKGLALFRQIGDQAGIGLCLNNQACALVQLKDLDRAEELGRAGLEARTQVGDPWHLAYSHVLLGDIGLERGNLEQAREHYLASLELRTRINDELGIATSKTSLGWVALKAGEREEAKLLFAESTRVLREQNDQQGQLYSLLGLIVWHQTSDLERAVTLAGAWKSATQGVSYGWSTADRDAMSELDRLIAESGKDLSAIMESGGKLTLSEAIDLALN